MNTSSIVRSRCPLYRMRFPVAVGRAVRRRHRYATVKHFYWIRRLLLSAYVTSLSSLSTVRSATLLDMLDTLVKPPNGRGPPPTLLYSNLQSVSLVLTFTSRKTAVLAYRVRKFPLLPEY